MADKAQTISFLDPLRKNRVGALLSGVIVMIAVALVLSAAVPDDLNSLIALFLILVLAVAVGFTVKVTSANQDAPAMFIAGGVAAIGVPVIFDAGTPGMALDDSILMSLSDNYLTVGSAFAAIVAIIVAGWGTRSK
jgi:uncharacterized membrane protein